MSPHINGYGDYYPHKENPSCNYPTTNCDVHMGAKIQKFYEVMCTRMEELNSMPDSPLLNELNSLVNDYVSLFDDVII